MSSIVYPLPKNENLIVDVENNFTLKKIVKIKNIGKDKCSLDSLLMAVSKEYQDADEESLRQQIIDEFKEEFKNSLKSTSKESEEEIYNKFLEAYEISDNKDNFFLKNPKNSTNIYDLVIDTYYEKDFYKIKLEYSLFNEETKEIFDPKDNIFSLIDKELIRDILDQNFITNFYKEKILQIKDKLEEEDNKKLRNQLNTYNEIIEFNLNPKNNLSFQNLYEAIDNDLCKNEDIILKIVSCILKFNVYLCRSWNTEISVIKKIFWKDEYPSIILFKLDSSVSLTGSNKELGYETGGVKSNGEIRTILLPDQDIATIKDLDKIYENKIDSYYLDKYQNYLNKLPNSMSFEKLQENYEVSDDEESEEEEEKETSEVEESEEEEEKELTKEEKKMKLLDETFGKPELEEEEIVEEFDEDVYIPGFIRSYTDEEIRKLLTIFIGGSYESVSRRKLEILYKNYIMNNLDESVDSIMERIRNN